MADLDPARREELAEVISAELYEALMDATADQWRQWRFLTDFAKEQYRAEGSRIVADALAPLIARWLADARAEGAAERGRGCCGYDTGYADGKAEGAAEVRAEGIRLAAYEGGLWCGECDPADQDDDCCVLAPEIRAALAEPTKETP